MADENMLERVAHGPGFIAALDQSGGSTPGALKHYGIAETEWSGDADMFRLMHEMRSRIMTAPAFDGSKVVAAILFEQTMDGTIAGEKTPAYLWGRRRIVPFLKIDKGLEDERDGVRLMKPIAGLDALLERAVSLGVFGTKERSVINLASDGVAAIVDQQFELAAQVARHGLCPIIEPEVLIKSPEKAAAEERLREEITRHLDADPSGYKVMLKLTLPEQPDLYQALCEHPRVVRVVALSGGYPRAEACRRLAENHGVIASFSRALIDDLKRSMDDAQFNATLATAVDEIYAASTTKH